MPFWDSSRLEVLLEMPDGLWAIEIKRAATPRLSKGFHLACADLNPARRIVVHGGAEAFRLSPEIDALPLSMMLQEVAAA